MAEIADRLAFRAPTPVVMLAGAAKSQRKVQTMAGICRGTHNANGIIIDSGMGTNIEKFCIRRGVDLIGVCPEAEIKYPKLLKKQKNELSNGHTHFVLIGKENKKVKYAWGDECELKYNLAKRIARGDWKTDAPRCRIITIVLGEIEESAIEDMEVSVKLKIPIIVLEGSPLC